VKDDEILITQNTYATQNTYVRAMYSWMPQNTWLRDASKHVHVDSLGFYSFECSYQKLGFLDGLLIRFSALMTACAFVTASVLAFVTAWDGLLIIFYAFVTPQAFVLS